MTRQINIYRILIKPTHPNAAFDSIAFLVEGFKDKNQAVNRAKSELQQAFDKEDLINPQLVKLKVIKTQYIPADFIISKNGKQ